MRTSFIAFTFFGLAASHAAAGEPELLSVAICFDKEVVLVAEDEGFPRLEKVDGQRLEKIAKHLAAREWFGLSSAGNSESPKKFPRAAVRPGSRSNAGRTVQDAVVLGPCSDSNALYATQKLTRPKTQRADELTTTAVAQAVFDEVCPGGDSSACPRAALTPADGLARLEVLRVGPELPLHIATYGLSTATKDASTRFLSLLSVSEGKTPKLLSTIGNYRGPESKDWQESVSFSELVEVANRKIIVARVDTSQEGGGASAVQLFQISQDGSVTETSVELASTSRK
ncbi:MAG: hypothetical protein HY791_37990 [Deltaproteobacteria bacterium]|nr:hypothetical protein [Deltaproteobacteria bacterium]